MINKADVLLSLRPFSQFSIVDDNVTWLDDVQTMPTHSEIKNESIRLKEIHTATKYKRDRASEYAKLNQDELRYDDLINGTTYWHDAIAAIKAKFPKPV